MVKQIMERAPPTDTTKANDKGGSGGSHGGSVHPPVPVIVFLGVTLGVMIVGSGWWMLGGGKDWTMAKWDKLRGNKADVV
jgi:hypothetical protein